MSNYTKDSRNNDINSLNSFYCFQVINLKYGYKFKLTKPGIF